jgi:hypothetical protein
VSDILWPEFSERPPTDIGVIRRDVWQRMQAGLYLMATTGWSVVQELMVGPAEKFGIQPDADSLHRIFRLHLREAGLIQYQVLPHAIKNGLAVVRLTDLGKTMCSSWGWPVVASDWGKLIEHHAGEDQPHHTAMVLDFARQARRRGYKVEVMPVVESRFMMPDAYIERGATDKAIVEVERGRNKPEKWRNLYALQGFIAVCTTTQARRRAIYRDEIQPLEIRCLTTDLETLKMVGKGGDIQHLWLECW